MEQVGRALVGGVQDFSGTSSRGVHRGGVKQTVAAAQVRRPTVSIEDVPLNEFQTVLASQVGCMGADMVRFFGVVEIAHRPSYGVTVFKQVPYDVISDVAVDTSHEDAFW